uniref:Non-lysosomal glucosylceramidase n=1 Tax=Stylophora pistillata TaxID=50429 RepID=A0A2B4RB04_STYPI
MPVKVKMIAYNPFIPADADASGIPIAIFKYEVTNTTNQNISVAISGNIRNFIGMDGQKNTSNWKKDVVPVGAKNNLNKYLKSDDLQGIYMFSNGVAKNASNWGTMALSTPDKNVTYRTSGVGNAWQRTMLDFWDDFSADGLLVEKKEVADENPMASLATKRTIAAGATEVFTFYFSWHFPNRKDWNDGKQTIGNYYTTRYKDAWEVLSKEVANLPKLTEKSLQFVKAFVSSDYAPQVKEAALFNLSTLRSQTVFRTPDGKMFGWEGVMDRVGSCYGSCTHVWNYEQATPFLFGSLAKTMREVEFGYALRKNGHMGFRVYLPLKKDPEKASLSVAAADGQMGTIMKFYRDWQLSGDDSFLKKYWKKVKSALGFAWVKGGWDADKDGVMEGAQHNTMDVEYFGANPQMQLWYLGALKAAEKMAKAMNDKKFANKCNRLFKKGSDWTDKNLFNGSYYEHKIELPKSKNDIAKGLVAGMGSKKLKDPDYQLSKGCLVDQLVGQYMASILGLGYLVKKENIQKTLQSILKYNARDNMFDYFNNMRSYMMGDEKGLVMASWPKGGRPKVPFPYWGETMTGFEYTAAVGMLYEGLEKEGLGVIQNIRDRYQGNRRSPFDEAECGRHYARAMASWAAVLAQSGFHYSGVDKKIQFTEKAGKYFWSNGFEIGEEIIIPDLGKNVVRKLRFDGILIEKDDVRPKLPKNSVIDVFYGSGEPLK